MACLSTADTQLTRKTRNAVDRHSEIYVVI